MDVDNSYSELGLTAQSTDAEIKAAWRRLAARWHPDRNDSPAALRKIQRINRALEEIRRARRTALAEDADTGAATDASTPGRTYHHTVRLTLEEAASGCVREWQSEVADDCAECAGSGLQTRADACASCGGAGRVRQPLWFGWMSAPGECSACHGQGVARQPCGACEGAGKEPVRKYRCRVPIPAGTRGGDLLHFPARAQAQAGARNEALCVRVELQPHAFFGLDDDGTVKCDIPVDGFAWIASRWIEVPTPSGLQQMRLKRGHLVYRIRGQGFPSKRSGPRADCIVTVVPLFPEQFSSQQEALIDRLVASNSGTPATAAGSRLRAWNEDLEQWQAGLAEQPRENTQA